MSTTETTTDEFEVARDKALQALDGGLRLRVRDGRGTRKQIIDEAVLQIARRITEVEQLREEISARRIHDEATTHHLNVALWLHAEARAEVEQINRYWATATDHEYVVLAMCIRERDEAREEIAKLQHALSVAEPHEAEVRLEVEREVRAEFAEKAGA